MNLSSRTRMLTAIVAGAVLVLAFMASSRVRACCPFSTPVAGYPRCDSLLQQHAGTTTLSFGPGAGVTQPVLAPGNFPACSVRMVPEIYSSKYGRVDVLQWDPVALAPDPTTVALRTVAFSLSSYADPVRANLSPPVVTRMVAGLADPPRSAATAADVVSGFTMTTYDDPNAAPGDPVAFTHAIGGAYTPLPGSHPVLAHGVCGGDAFLQGQCLTQCVKTTDAATDTGTTYELVQRFRVPQTMSLSWVELAFGTRSSGGNTTPGLIGILDANDQPAPPVSLPPSLVDALFSNCDLQTPVWASHYQFDHTITLVAGHDYWLLARVAHAYSVYERVLTGSEGSAFTSAIGPLFSRGGAADDWNVVAGRALSFRMIGVPIGFVGTGPMGTALGPLRLRVSPNPAPGSVSVTWTGATGVADIEVLDARGWRVAGGPAAAASGHWTWSGTRDDGRRALPGVYFVRVYDRAGRVGVERVVLIR
jgi:hypothetical protein